MTAKPLTVEDFITAMATRRARISSQFMRWYEQAGTPELAWSLTMTPTTKTRRAHSSQSQITPATPGQPTRNRPLHDPMKLGLLGANGQRSAAAPGEPAIEVAGWARPA